MRSQNEILTKLTEISKHKSDPSEVQHRILCQKLTWENAKKQKIINPKYDDKTHKRKWKENACMDYEYLKKELEEAVDATASDYFAKDHMKVLADLQGLLVMVWLFGSLKDNFMPHLFQQFNRFGRDQGYMFLRILCDEFQFNWKIRELRYNTKSGGIIT